VNQPPPRLNLIQRAMQLSNVSRETARVDGTAPVLANGRSRNAFPEMANGEGLTPRREGDSTQVARQAEPVHLDSARLRASRIITPESKDSATYNEFRSLKRKLIPLTIDDQTNAMTRNIVMVTSALPREGKTFTVMNLAFCLAAERNLDVILVDGDVVRGAVAGYFDGGARDGLVELLTENRQGVAELLHPVAALPRLHVLFAGKRHEAVPELLASPRMADIRTMLAKHFPQSIVLIDTPPVLASPEAAALAAHADHLIMLVSSSQASRHQVEAALTEVSCCQSIQLLFNRAPQWQRPLTGAYSYYSESVGETRGS
jgi:receptor protein-tyrosine kinase